MGLSPTPVMGWIGGVSIIMGSVMAIAQRIFGGCWAIQCGPNWLYCPGNCHRQCMPHGRGFHTSPWDHRAAVSSRRLGSNEASKDSFLGLPAPADASLWSCLWRWLSMIGLPPAGLVVSGLSAGSKSYPMWWCWLSKLPECCFSRSSKMPPERKVGGPVRRMLLLPMRVKVWSCLPPCWLP